MNDTNISMMHETVSNRLVIRIQGNLDVHNSHKIEPELMTLVKSATSAIVYDLEEVPFISSAGLRVLVTSLRMSQEHGHEISICSLKPAVAKVFDIIGMQQLFKIHSDLKSALQ